MISRASIGSLCPCAPTRAARTPKPYLSVKTLAPLCGYQNQLNTIPQQKLRSFARTSRVKPCLFTIHSKRQQHPAVVSKAFPVARVQSTVCEQPVAPSSVSASPFSGDLLHTTIYQGQVTVWQPTHGYRSGVDSRLLASFAPVRARETVLELGIGTGAASLALAHQQPEACIHGVELQTDLLPITQQNIDLNGWTSRFKLFPGSVTEKIVEGNSYDHVIMNPPFWTVQELPKRDWDDPTNLLDESFFSPEARRRSGMPAAGEALEPEAAKVLGRRHRIMSTHGDGNTTFHAWVVAARRALKLSGCLTLVYPGDRLDQILAIFMELKFGAVEVYPLFLKAGEDAKRVLVRARKGGGQRLKLYQGLVVNTPEGVYTPEADAILTGGHKISVES